MNRASIFLLLCLFSLMGMAQEPADSGLTRLAERARLIGERIPQEKVFVQIDNTCYFLGDTIWFSAFTRRTNSGRPSKISRVLYAELWNHDGFLVERKLVEMRNGRGSGFFALPDTLYSGYFELRAYTRWQLNWGQTEHPHNKYSELWFYNKAMAKDFFRDYEKLYSRVFPVYDKPKEQGEFNRDMTLRPLRRYFKNDPEPPKLLLSLFPEGGNMVAGMPCKVAFEAALEDGEYKEGSLSLQVKGEGLRVKNEKGEEVTEVMTENRGRGSFTFTPEEGKSYEAVFTSSDEKTAKQKIKDFEKEGVSLQVRQEGDQWLFDINTNLDKPLGMTIMHEGVVERFQTLDSSELTESLVFNGQWSMVNDKLKAGINQVTIFDEEGRVWADRLFFVTKPELTKPTIAVSGLKAEYQPFEEIDLTLTLSKGEGRHPLPMGERDGERGFSLSVRDAVRQDNTFDSGNIMTEMLLSSEIKGFVPKPEWFFEKDDEEHRRALDLLMMTQGWRRFAWREMIKEEEWKPIHPAEQYQVVTGTVNRYYLENMNSISGRRGKKYEEGKLHKEKHIYYKFVKLGEDHQTAFNRTKTENGIFQIEIPRFYGDCEFFLAANDSSKEEKIWRKFKPEDIPNDDTSIKKKKWINRFADVAKYYVRLDFPYPRFVKPYTFYQTAIRENEYKWDDSISPATSVMKEVTIRSQRNGIRYINLKKPLYVLDAYEAGNTAMDAGLTSHLYGTTPMAYGIIRNYIGDMGSYRQYTTALYYDTILVEVRNHAERQRFWRNTMIQPTDRYRYEHLQYIDKIYLYSDYSPRREGDKQFTQDNQPSVEISLHRYPNWEERITYRNRRYLLHGFAYQEDFYHPDYKRNPPKAGQKDHRRTLYWNPDLKLDENGEAHVTLFNNSRRTQIKVEANGMTSEGGFLYNSK